ncbi:MAG: branched-chain amino acid ABC transporter permease [Anaerolineae bacterium]|nr:branched-chain amino acid ABC transporter permease [Anaerolineae bacterium]
MKKIQRGTLVFAIGAILVFAIIQVLLSLQILNSFWFTIIRIGAVMAIVSLGLNLIYGFNGQFSLGQWAFYAIGAYASADATYRWTQLHSALGVLVLLFAVVLSGVAILLIGRWVSRIRGMDALSQFALYLIATVLLVWVAVLLGKALDASVTAFLASLPKNVSLQIVFFVCIILAGLLAAEVSFLFGLPVLTLGSDYFGIATLGLTIIVKVLLDNSDTMLGFPEMKGARGMIGIPKITTWFWVFTFLILAIVITRNLLLSSYGRAIISVREDEIAAKAMGIDIAFYKTLTFVIGSFFAGVAGALYAHINGFLHPNTFNFIKSFDPLIIVVFGGLGSVTGTVAASFAWALVLEGFLRLWLPEGFETWRFVVYPLLLLIMMLLKPNGLLGNYEIAYLRNLIPPLRNKNENQTPPPPPLTVATDTQEVKS